MSATVSAPLKVYTREPYNVATPPTLASPEASRPPSPSRTSSFQGFAAPQHFDKHVSESLQPSSRSTSHSRVPLMRGQRGADERASRARRWKASVSRSALQRGIGFAMIALVGFNDSATGANLDSMREHYDVSFSQISTVFLSNIAGYFFSCLLASFLTHHLGLNHSLLVAAAFMAGGCLTMALVPPFPVFVVSLALLGFGAGRYDASLTTVVAHDEDALTMATLYAFFGVGAVIASLLVGALLDRGIAWNMYYYIPMTIALVLAVIGYPAFRTYEPPADEEPSDIQLTSLPPTSVGGDIVHGRARLSVQTRMKRTLSMKAVLVGFFLIICAFGTSDTLSAWMVSFMVEKRGSPPAASRYQLAGLWGGIALGRVVLGLVGTKMSEKTFAVMMLTLASGCLGVVWAVRQYVVDAVLLCFAGFFIGPVTPKVLSAVSARVPPSLKATAMSLTIGLGLIGSGAGPLLFGFVAGHGWLGSLPAVLIVTCILSCLGWLALPRNKRRDD